MIKQVMKSFALASMVLGSAVLYAQDAPITAVAEMNPTAGNQVQGEIKFVQKKGYILVIADIKGLTPGAHPFHVHAVGDCSSKDGSSAGGHFKPTQMQAPVVDGKTVDLADLGKLTPNSQGSVHYTHHDKYLQLTGVDSIIGKGVVIHASDSPARMACGVIQQLQTNQ